MKCSHVSCESVPRNTLRAKTAPGQWQMLAAACDAHLMAVVEKARAEHPTVADAIQCVPFTARDWPEPKEKTQ